MRDERMPAAAASLMIRAPYLAHLEKEALSASLTSVARLLPVRVLT